MKGFVFTSIVALCLFGQVSYAQDETPLSIEVDKQVERATDTENYVHLFLNGEKKDEMGKAPDVDEGISEKDLAVEPAKASEELIGDFEGTVTHVYDADMIDIDGERMRLLGVNAPESPIFGETAHCYSDQAKSFLEALVLNKVVTYSYDRMYGRRDRYGDKRIYLYFDGKFVNAELIAKGQAFADPSKNCSELEELLPLQIIARRKHLGLWHSCPVECERRGVCRTKIW